MGFAFKILLFTFPIAGLHLGPFQSIIPFLSVNHIKLIEKKERKTNLMSNLSESHH